MIPLLRASHFQPTLAVTAITTALAVAVGRGLGSIWVALAVFAGQLSVGWSNDYLDRGRDATAGRTDKPIVSGRISARAVGVGAVAAVVVCVPLSFASGWRAARVHLVAVASAGVYNARLKMLALSVLAYMASFALLPAFVTLGLASHRWPPAWAMVAAALLGAGAHFINTLADIDADAATGVRGLPQRLGPERSLLMGTGLMAAATAVVVFAPAGGPDVLVSVLAVGALIAVVGVVVVARAGHDRAAWSLTLCTAGLAVAVFLANGSALT